MTATERIQRARAEEQLADLAGRRLRRWERDSWAIRPGRPVAAEEQAKRPCLAGDCADQVVGLGYCKRHLGKVRAGVALDRDLRQPRGGR